MSDLGTWIDGPAKSAIVDFVGRVTTEGPDYVAPQDRIAVFDNDGTLWCEKPAYIQLDFLVRRLAAQSDVVLENFKSGDLARYGLDAATLCALYPRLVYCSITGFGQDGPYEKRPGYDQIAQGMGGLMSITGEPGAGPMRVGIPIADLTSALLATRYRAGIGNAIVRRASIREQAERLVETGLQPAQVRELADLPPDARAVLRWLRRHGSLAEGLRGLYVDVGMAFASVEQSAAWADLGARREGAPIHGRRLVLAAATAWGR